MGENIRGVRFWRSSDEREAADKAKVECEALIARLDVSPEQAATLTTEFRASVSSPALSDRERNGLMKSWARAQDNVFRAYAETVLADDHLTVQEELSFFDLSEALGVDDEALGTTYRDVLFRLVVARANDGRLSEIEEPRLLRKGDEAVYLETQAALMKEVAIREYQGGYGGFSFRVAKGVRYSTGRTRGRSVVVGTELQIADVGILSVSSKRLAFIGERKSMEFPYAKLMSFEVYSDGIRLHASNRQTTPLFKLESGDVVAATLNEAMQRFEDAPPTRRGTRRTDSEQTS
jgi:hypothetical protein